MNHINCDTVTILLESVQLIAMGIAFASATIAVLSSYLSDNI